MTTTHRISTGIALVLALAASAASASARPFDLNANGSFVPAGSASLQAPSQSTGVPPILPAPRSSQQAVLRRVQHQEELASTGPRSEVVSGGDYGPINTPGTVVRVLAHDGGFDWGAAGIGAGGVLGLAFVGVGGAFAISQQRRGRQSKRSAVITS
jgi:hypothetical protein